MALNNSHNTTNNTELTQERLREAVWYNYETGHFTWIKTLNPELIGKRTGHTDKGYRRTDINGRRYFDHRLAFMYHYGSFPTGDLQLDHIDNDPSNNSFSNLRICTPSQNSSNSTKYSNNRTGHKGVSHCTRTGKFVAQICFNKAITYLGVFHTVEEASAVYLAAARELHGEFFNAG